MKCPKCKTSDLQAAKLDGGLPAMGCAACGGTSIALLYYRDWAERAAADLEPATEAAVSEPNQDSKTALPCAKCGSLMTKFAIAGTTDNKLDLCTRCDEAWLDGGEWELLKSLNLAKEIPAVLTDAWQRKVREERMEAKRRDRLERVVGSEDLAKVEAFREWLVANSHRTEILFYLNQ